ncbi:MAG: hypothetical protein ABSH16_04505 [Sedimentisphaerales bacterium]
MALGDKIVHILKSYVIKSATVGFAVLWIVLAIWLLHRHVTGTYYNAKKAMSDGNIAEATKLFGETVRQDIKGLSFKALLTLMKMNELLALEELVDLIDLPDLNWIVVEDRERFFNVIRRRTAGTTADLLPLNPNASQEIRTEEKHQWQTWLVKAKEQYNWQNGRFVPKK